MIKYSKNCSLFLCFLLHLHWSNFNFVTLYVRIWLLMFLQISLFSYDFCYWFDSCWIFDLVNKSSRRTLFLFPCSFPRIIIFSRPSHNMSKQFQELIWLCIVGRSCLFSRKSSSYIYLKLFGFFFYLRWLHYCNLGKKLGNLIQVSTKGVYTAI